MLSFGELERRYGLSVAYQCLTEIEKAASIPSYQFYHVDPEARLQYAQRVQDAMTQAA
ncbi:MAG: hypothetical protein P4N59_05495 [Negativicutes bacterium]|nr:hypothetical protein [Negativicutes bacterium]